MKRVGAAVAGAAGAIVASVAVSAVVDQDARVGLAEMLATLIAAPTTALLYPVRRWGARQCPPEALASVIRAQFVDDESPAMHFWTFALSRRTGLVWLREVPRNGRRWRAGSTADFRPAIRVRVRDLPEEDA